MFISSGKINERELKRKVNTRKLNAKINLWVRNILKDVIFLVKLMRMK